MTPICQNVHDEDRAQFKDLGVLSESTLLEYNYVLQASISDCSKIWVVQQMDDL